MILSGKPGNNKFKYVFEPENGIDAGNMWFMVVNQGQSNARLALPVVTLGNEKPGGNDDDSGNPDNKDSTDETTDAGSAQTPENEGEYDQGGCGCSIIGKNKKNKTSLALFLPVF